MRVKREETVRSAVQAFKAIDDLLRTPGGNCNTSIDYMEQTSWLLFLRYLDARETERRDEAELRGERYEPALPRQYAWLTWSVLPCTAWRVSERFVD